MVREKLYFRVSLLGLQLLFLSFLLSLLFPKYSFAQTEEPRWERIGLEGWKITGKPAIAINPIDPKIVYVIAHTENTDPNGFYPEVYDLFKTTNSGVSWESKKNGLPTNNSGLYVSSIAIDPINPETLFVATQEGWGPFRDGGIYKTINGGNTWTRVLRGIGYINLAVDYESPNIVFALNAGVNNPFGFYKSIDGGISWERKGIGIVTYPTYYRKIILDPTDNTIVYVLTGSYNGSSGIFKSVNGGETFVSIPDNVGLQGEVYDMAIDYVNNQTLYAAVSTSTDIAGVYKSINGGNTWFRSSNGLNNADAGIIEIDPFNSNILYIPAYKGRSGQGILFTSPYYSTDNAQTWVSFNYGLPQDNTVVIYDMFTTKNLGYIVGTSQNGLWKYPLINSTPPSPTPTPTFIPTPTVTPTPTPQLCVLEHFGDFFGNPVRQTDPQWAETPYGGTYISGRFVPFKEYELGSSGSKDSIANWGCMLTSQAMIVNYAAKQQGINFETNPWQLNDWLQKNGGYSLGHFVYSNGVPIYVTGSGVKPLKIQEFAWNYDPDRRVFVGFDGHVYTNSHPVVDNQLCHGNGAILEVDNGGYTHYVAASGQAFAGNVSTFRLHDPLENTPITLYQKYYNQFTRITRMKTSLGIFPRWMILYLMSPAELLITDPDGNKLGINPTTGEHFSDIADGTYGEEAISAADRGGGRMAYKVLSIKNPKEGNYIVEVIGTDLGEYALNIDVSDESANVQTTHIEGDISDTLVHTYSAVTDNATTILERLIDIDVSPASDLNIIRLYKKKVIRVAVLTMPEFDPATLDPDSLQFGPSGAYEKHDKLHFKDIDKDGDKDVVLHFVTNKTGLAAGDKEACLYGKTKDGLSIKGCDGVKIVEGKKKNK